LLYFKVPNSDVKICSNSNEKSINYLAIKKVSKPIILEEKLFKKSIRFVFNRWFGFNL